MSIEKRALIFARRAHESVGQMRKYTSQPYIVHPMSVANIVKSVRHTSEMVAAAYLHDVVEDTDTTSEQIHLEFGHGIGNLVDWLTDVATPADGNRVARKAIELERLRRAPPCAQTIKMADLIDNADSIRAHDPSFWAVYRGEMLALVDALVLADEGLRQRARSLVE